MSATTTTTDRTFRQRWVDFWFTPSDPTTLGFIRVMTGLLVVYVHLTYSLDLQAFFGKYGWYGAQYIERERHEFPWMTSSFWEWDDPHGNPPRVPDFPHRRQAVMGFIRSLPETAAGRTEALRYLNRAVRSDNNQALAGLKLVQDLVETLGQRNPEDRDALYDQVTTALSEGRQAYIGNDQFHRVVVLAQPADALTARDSAILPEYLLTLPASDRAAVAGELRSFLRALPRDTQAARYVVMHFMEDSARRFALVEWLNSMPDDAAERKRLTDYLDYWSNDPRKTIRQGSGTVSVWFHVTNPTEMALIHAFVLVVMVLFTLGFCTRVTSVLTWLAALGYVQRTNQILFGMDTMMNILLVYLMIGNSGAALSVDRLVARYRAARASLRRSGTIDEATRAFLTQAPPSVGANLGIRLIQVHFCFIYLAAGFSKLKGPGWWNGTAFWDVMINPEFTLLRYEWFERLAREFASIKPLYQITTTLGVWFTWGIEIAFPFLVWTRVRPFMLWLAVLLHAGIGVLMGLNLFELLMMVMLLVYFPPGVIRDRLRGGTGLKSVGFQFNPADAKQSRAAALIAAADIDGQVLPEPRRTDRPAVTVGGPPVSGGQGVPVVFAELRFPRLLRLALWVPGVSSLFTRLLFPEPTVPGSGTPRSGPPAPATAS